MLATVKNLPNGFSGANILRIGLADRLDSRHMQRTCETRELLGPDRAVPFIMAAETSPRAVRAGMPDEIGLDWLADVEKPNFNGRKHGGIKL